MAKSRILSLNCEGVKNCMSYLSNLLKDTDCDILCLQETWTLDNTIDILGSIHNNYDFTVFLVFPMIIYYEAGLAVA